MMHLWRLSILVLPAAAGALVFAGCSGDDSTHFTGTDPDAAAEAAAGDDAATDTGAGPSDTGAPGSDAGADASLPCPSYSGNDAYCKALVAYCNRCSPQLTPCAVDNFAHCEKVSQVYSKEGRAAQVECYAKVACDRDPSTAIDRCVKDRLAGGTPSAAQAKLRDDVCVQCSPDDAGASACEAEFFTKADGGPGGGVFVLEFDDSIAAATDTTCASGAVDAGNANACATRFGVCATLVIAGALPKDACRDGG